MKLRHNGLRGALQLFQIVMAALGVWAVCVWVQHPDSVSFPAIQLAVLTLALVTSVVISLVLPRPRHSATIPVNELDIQGHVANLGSDLSEPDLVSTVSFLTWPRDRYSEIVESVRLSEDEIVRVERVYVSMPKDDRTLNYIPYPVRDAREVQRIGVTGSDGRELSVLSHSSGSAILLGVVDPLFDSIAARLPAGGDTTAQFETFREQVAAIIEHRGSVEANQLVRQLFESPAIDSLRGLGPFGDAVLMLCLSISQYWIFVERPNVGGEATRRNGAGTILLNVSTSRKTAFPRPRPRNVPSALRLMWEPMLESRVVTFGLEAAADTREYKFEVSVPEYVSIEDLRILSRLETLGSTDPMTGRSLQLRISNDQTSAALRLSAGGLEPALVGRVRLRVRHFGSRSSSIAWALLLAITAWLEFASKGSLSEVFLSIIVPIGIALTQLYFRSRTDSRGPGKGLLKRSPFPADALTGVLAVSLIGLAVVRLLAVSNVWGWSIPAANLSQSMLMIAVFASGIVAYLICRLASDQLLDARKRDT